MTDQKQAPEREVIEFLRFGFTDPSRANVVEALAKQRDELAAERDELAEQLDPSYIDAMSARISELSVNLAEYFMRVQREMARAEKAEAERDQALADVEHYSEACDEWADNAEIALAASAAREIAMRDRAADVADMFDAMCIRALPLSPDGQRALDEMLAKAYEAGKVVGALGIEEENPHRQPSRSSAAGKTEDRG